MAFAVAQHMGAKPKDIIEKSLQNYTPVGARLRMESGPTGYQILNDVYNANPLSIFVFYTDTGCLTKGTDIYKNSLAR